MIGEMRPSCWEKTQFFWDRELWKAVRIEVSSTNSFRSNFSVDSLHLRKNSCCVCYKLHSSRAKCCTMSYPFPPDSFVKWRAPYFLNRQARSIISDHVRPWIKLITYNLIVCDYRWGTLRLIQWSNIDNTVGKQSGTSSTAKLWQFDIPIVQVKWNQ